MAHWTLPQGPNASYTPSVTASYPTSVTVTASTNPHEKGPWTEVLASAPNQTKALTVSLGAVSLLSTNTAMLVDIGMGAAGSENVIVSNITVGHSGSTLNLRFPMDVPAGARIAVRCQSVVASKTIGVSIGVEIGQPAQGTSCRSSYVTYGADTTNSRGTGVTTSSTVDTFGSWVEIATSTTAPISELLVLGDLYSSATVNNSNVQFEIGVGGAGSEVVIAENFFAANSSEYILNWNPAIKPLGATIPTGSRLSARARRNLVNGVTYGCVLIGAN